MSAPSRGERLHVVLEVLFIWILGTLAHVQALSVGYLADDYDLVGAAGSRSYRLRDAFPAGRGTYFRPLVMASLRLERLVTSGPLLHHLTNLALHLGNATVLYAICRALFAHRTRALVASLVFLLHPLVVTNVFWISGRTDSLCTFFALLSVLAFVKSIDSGGRALGLASGAALLCALLSKETAVAMPVVLWTIALLRKRASRSPRPTLVGLSVLTVAYVGFLVLRFYGADGARPSPSARSLLRGVLAVPAALVWPNEATSLRAIVSAQPLLVAGGLAVVAFGGVVAIVWLRRRAPAERRTLLVLGAMAAAPIAPLILSGVNASSRLMYLPLAIGCIALAGVLDLFGPATWKVLVVGVAALVPMVAGSHFHGQRWVEASRLTAGYCRDFKALRGADVTRPPLFVTAPDELHDVPLHSNDLGAALHHCAHGTFGDLELVSLAPVILDRVPDEPVVQIRRSSPEHIEVLARPGATFHIDAPSASAPITLPEATVSLVGSSDVRRLDVVLTAAAPIDLFYFDGLRITRVPPP